LAISKPHINVIGREAAIKVSDDAALGHLVRAAR